MSENKETIYCGSGKKQNEKWLKASICLTDLPAEHIFEYNGKKYLKLNININDQPNQFGKDVSLSVDTWKPEVQAVGNDHVTDPKEPADDGLPF